MIEHEEHGKTFQIVEPECVLLILRLDPDLADFMEDERINPETIDRWRTQVDDRSLTATERKTLDRAGTCDLDAAFSIHQLACYTGLDFDLHADRPHRSFRINYKRVGWGEKSRKTEHIEGDAKLLKFLEKLKHPTGSLTPIEWIKVEVRNVGPWTDGDLMAEVIAEGTPRGLHRGSGLIP